MGHDFSLCGVCALTPSNLLCGHTHICIWPYCRLYFLPKYPQPCTRLYNLTSQKISCETCNKFFKTSGIWITVNTNLRYCDDLWKRSSSYIDNKLDVIRNSWLKFNVNNTCMCQCAYIYKCMWAYAVCILHIFTYIYKSIWTYAVCILHIFTYIYKCIWTYAVCILHMFTHIYKCIWTYAVCILHIFTHIYKCIWTYAVCILQNTFNTTVTRHT